MSITWGTLTGEQRSEIADLTNRIQTLQMMMAELDVDLETYAGNIRNQKLTLQSEISVISNRLTHIRRPVIT